MVALRDPGTGLVHEVSDDDAYFRQREGWRQATAEEQQQAALKKEYGSMGHMALAGAAAVGRGLTFGLSDVALTQLGGDDVRQALAAYQVVHPGTSLAGELVGSALGMGGAGKLLSAPTRAVVGAGEAAEALVLGERTAAEAGAARAILGAGARGVIEGGAQGLGAGITQATLDDDYSAEHLIAAAGMGAAVGGGMGAVFTAGGRALSKGARRLVDALSRPGGEAAERLVERATGEAAAPGLGDAIGRFWAKTAELAGAEGTTAGRELMAANAAGREARTFATEAEQVISKQSSRAAEAFAEQRTALQGLGEDFAPTLSRRDTLRKAINVQLPGETLQAARAHVGKVATELEDMMLTGAERGAGPLGTTARGVYRRLGKTTDLAEAFQMLGNLRRELAGAAPGSSRIAELADGVRGVLENQALWGDAARLQQKAGAFDIVKRELDEVLGAEGSVQKALERPRSESSAATIASYKSQLDRGEQLVETLRETSALDRGQRKALERYSQAIATTRDAIGQVETAGLRREQLAKLTGADQLLVAGVAGVAGAALGGDDLGTLTPLAVLGAAIANPGRAVRQLAAVESLAGRVSRRLAAAPSKLARGASAERVAAWTALDGAVRMQQEKRLRAVAAANPELVAEQTKARLGGFANAAPNVVDAAARVAARATAYLQAHAPKPPLRPGVVFQLKLPPSDYELEVFERRRRAAHDPMSVLRDVDDGSITHEAVHAVQNIYPRLYGDMKSAYLSELSAMAERGKELPFEQVAALEILLGTPLQGINSPEVVAQIQETYAPPPEPEPAGPPARRGRAPETAEFYRTEQTALIADAEHA